MLYIWLIIGILTLPTHLAQLIPFLIGKFPPPFLLYVFSLMTNIGLSFLIGFIEIDIYKPVQLVIYLLLGCSLYITGLVLSYANTECFRDIKNEWEIPGRIENEIKAGILDQEDFNNQLAQNRLMPPVIQVIARSFHYEQKIDKYYDMDGNLVTRTITFPFFTYYNDAILLYKSWQEEGNPITLEENTSMLHGKIDCKFLFDQKSLEIINCMRNALYLDAKPRDLYCIVLNNFYVPDMKEIICGTTRPPDGKMPCSSKWIPTCGGKFLIQFLKVFGYQSIIYSLWVSIGQNMKMKLVKRISMLPKEQSGLRCDYNSPDFESVEQTFHCENPTFDVEQPQFDQNEINETLISSSKTYYNSIADINPDGQITLQQGREENNDEINNQEFQMSNSANIVVSPTNTDSQFVILRSNNKQEIHTNNENINAISDNNNISGQSRVNNTCNNIKTPKKIVENEDLSNASLSNSDDNNI